MTAQTERTNEARVIPDSKPILMKLIGIKASKPQVSKQSGKTTKMVSWVLVVDDRKYPECQGVYVSYRTSSWSASGMNGGRSSNCYLFIAMLLGEAADQFELVDLYDILTPYEEGGKQKLQRPNEMLDLWGKYLVGWMNPAEPDANGRIWQNPKEFKPPAFLDWDVEDRKALEQPKEHKPLGLPTPKHAAPAPVPPPQETHAPAPEPVPDPTPAPAVQPERPSTKAMTMVEIDDWIKANAQNHGELIKRFVREQKRVQRIGLLSEADRRHLWAMMQVEARMICDVTDDRNAAIEIVSRHLELRGADSFEDLDTSDLLLLITTIDLVLAGDVPF